MAVENKNLRKEIEGYTKVLAPIIEKHPDAVGYAVTINGEFSTADVYASQKLFRDIWTQHLENAATEAISLENKAKKDQEIDLSWREPLFKDGRYQRKIVQRTGGANHYVAEQNGNFLRYNSLLTDLSESLHMSDEKQVAGESLDQRPGAPRNPRINQQNIPLPPVK